MNPPRGPTIVICGGSYHLPLHYEPLVKALEARDFEVRCPALPTMGVTQLPAKEVARIDYDPEPPKIGYPNGYTDVDAVRKEIKELVSQGKRVILVGHSYGGWLATESAAPEYQYQDGVAQGGVIGIFYITAFVIPVGQSIDSVFSPQGDETPPPPFAKLGKFIKRGLVTPIKTEEYFYNDIPVDEAQKWSGALRCQPVIKSVLRHASYLDLPCGYLFCKNDKVFPMAVQEIMVKKATEQGAKFKTFSCSGGHVPFYAFTKETVEAVVEFSSAI